jgi:hypothetical protein
LKHARTSIPASSKLTALLRIVEGQRELLSRGDLVAVQELQSKRQQLWEETRSLNKGDRDESRVVSKILALDREMVWLLLSEVAEIQEDMLKIRSLRKLLQSRPHARKRPAGNLSRHI